MAKVSHSSDLTRCRACGTGLDVFVPLKEQFCSEECATYFGAGWNAALAALKKYQDRTVAAALQKLKD